MVAARVTLLSLAALSSCMFGAFRGAPRSGRLERRLGLADDTSLSSVATAVSTLSSTSSSVESDTATTATQATDSSSTSSSTSTSAGTSSTSIISAADDGPCLTCSASETQASSPPPSPPSTSSTVPSLSVAGPSTSLSADTSSSSSVSETSSSSSESSSVPESDTATASHYDGRASITSAAGGASSAAPPPTKKLPPKLTTKPPPILASTSVDFGRPPPAESTSTSVPAAPEPTTSRKLPPAVPTGSVEQTLIMESTTVDFGRPPPAQTTSTLAPDMAWPPTDDAYATSKVPSDLFAGWSSTRGQADFDWGHVTSRVDDIDDISTWSRVTWSGGWQTVSDGRTRSVCQPSDLLKPSTIYSITHTSTITWTGNPRDYTPPYPPITTPLPCTRIDEDQHSGPQRLTLSRCTSTGTSGTYTTCEMTTVYDVSDKPKWTLTDFEPVPTNLPPVTFITTDKNPAVVFPHIETPDYGIGATTRFNVKNPPGGADRTAAVANNDSPSPSGASGGGSSPGAGGGSGSDGSGSGAANRPLGPPVTVSVRAGTVVINDQTFTDSPVLRTQIVRVGGEVFTIEPTRVVGAGATIIRPGTGAAAGAGAGAGAGGAPPATFAPQTTTVGGVPVVVSGRQAVVDGTTFSLDAPATTKIVGDRIVSIGPGGIAVATGASDPNPVRLTPAPAPTPAGPQQTEVVVAGGELVTAIGRSVFVIRSTTITYGPAVPATTIDVNGEPVVVGPSGVAMHGTVLGGPSARPGETQYEIVGGATLTQLAPSRVVIRGTTYTVGPGATSTTVVIGRETVTIGPAGVAVSSLSFYYPLGPGYATTITPGATAAAATADPTGGGSGSSGGAGADGGGDKKEEDAAADLRPAGLALNLLVSSVAVGLTLWLI